MSLKPNIIMDFDPGIADTGFGVISREGNNLKLLIAGSIKTSKGSDFIKRLVELHKATQKLVKDYQPDIIAIEKLYFAKNVKTALDVGQARGVLLLATSEYKDKILEFSPTEIKQTVTGNGQANKRQVGLMVKAILKLQSVPQPDDAADALAIAITASFFNPRLARK